MTIAINNFSEFSTISNFFGARLSAPAAAKYRAGMKRIAVLASVCLAFCALVAQNRYATERLHGIASALGMAERIELLPDGDYREGIAYAGYPLHVVVADGEVEHIGWSLPPAHESSPIFLFVERAALEKALCAAEALPQEWNCPDQAFYAEGAIEDVLSSDRANLSYTASNIQGRQYQARWATPEGQTLCAMAFPISYGLISGATMREMEASLFARLQALPACEEELVGYGAPSAREIEASYAKAVGPELAGSILENIIYLLPGEEKLIFDPQLPVESLANAISSTSASQGIEAKVKMIMYGANGGSRQFTMPLSALVGYFLREGCTPYFGLMEGDAGGGEIIGAVKMANPDMGYVHLMKVAADPAILFGPNPSVEVTLAAYVNDKIAQVKNIYE